MNTKRLQVLFQSYIEHFEFLNNKDNDENYKWVIAQMFHDTFDLEAEDFPAMLKEVWLQTANLIDGAQLHPFRALVTYAEHEPETVRQMYVDLFEDDGGDLSARQHKITTFINRSEVLRARYFSTDAWPYENDQRSVMAYLFLHDPDHNYLFKATQAREFADCVEFYDDWGTTAQLKLEVFYRMCDELVAAIKEYPPLMETHNSRFANQEKPMHPDAALHILAFDLIYSSQAYNLYSGIEYERPNAKEKKLFLERMSKAKDLQAAYNAAKDEAQKLQDVRDILMSLIKPGAEVVHKTFGKGVVEHIETTNGTSYIELFFGESSKRFVLFSGLANHFFYFCDDNIMKIVDETEALLLRDEKIINSLRRCESALKPYLEYLY